MASQFLPSDDHIRNVILFLFFSKPNANQSYERLKEVYKEGAPSRSTVYQWFSRFREGDYSMKDEERSGRPKGLDLNALRNQVEADPYQTTREISSTLEVNQSTVVRGLKSIGKVKKLGRWIPHVLTEYDMVRRVDAALSLLTLRRTHGWLDNLITGDEKWVLYSNVHRRAQWVDKEDEAEDVPKPDMHVKKVMLCVWWSVRGVEYWELLDEGRKVNAEIYVSQLQKLKAQLQLTRGEQANVYFLHDNATPHTAGLTKAELLKYGWTILPHPPYSPDLAPSDYHLFSNLQRHLDGKNFSNREDVKNELEAFFMAQPATFWRKGIYDLPTRWQKTIDVNGAYFK